MLLTKQIFLKAKKQGAFHIFAANLFSKLSTFFSSIILIRFLSKSDFGTWTYAMNFINIAMLVSGLGIHTGVLQYSSMYKPSRRKLSFLKFGLSFGILFNAVLSIAIYVLSFVIKLPIENANRTVRLLAFIPIVTIVIEVHKSYFRGSFQNTKFASINFLLPVLLLISSYIGVNLKGIETVIIFRYISFLIVIALCFKFRSMHNAISLSRVTTNHIMRIKILKFSIIAALATASSQMLYFIDTFLVGLIIKDNNIVATYKTATLIPFSLNFIPQSIIVFVYPYFARNCKDISYIKQNTKKLISLLLIFNTAISSILIIFAPTVIKYLFGIEYLDSVTPFRILSAGFLIAGSFRIPLGNILASINHIKFNLYNSIVCGVLNIILDIILIRNMGANGAAISTVSIFIFSSLFSLIYFKKILNGKIAGRSHSS